MIAKILGTTLTGLIFSALALAADPVDKAVEEQLRKNLAIPSMNLAVESVANSEIPGVYAVQFVNGPLVYANTSGSYFIVGDLYEVAPDGLVNITERSRDGERLALVEGVPEGEMIVFSPEGEARAHITVFTDTSCFYCQKLHQEVPELNKRGVEVRYLAYPRSGVDSESYRQMATAWCAENPQDTLTRLKNRETVANKVCEDNPVAAQYELGGKIGVRGTPAIVTESGQLIPGYQSADDLMVTLGLE
jgi:thiol:disulfide interchange protein DsbC